MSRSLTTRTGITTKDKQLALPGDFGLVWQPKLVALACAEVWPELTWKGQHESVWGRRGGAGVASIFCFREELDLSVTPPLPKCLGPEWEHSIRRKIALAEAAVELPRALKEARVWFGKQ